jgi:hypothetical protein
MMWLVWDSFGVTTVSAEVSEAGWIIVGDSTEARWSGVTEKGVLWTTSHWVRKRSKRETEKMGFDEDAAHQRKLR